MQFKTLAIPFVLMTAVLAAPAPQDSCPNVDSLHNILESTPGATEKFNELASGESTLTKRACLYDGCSECQLSCQGIVDPNPRAIIGAFAGCMLYCAAFCC